MRNPKLIIAGILLAMIVGLSGCIITSASPDPKQIVEIKPGDKILFKVTGPVNTPTSRCVWTINRRNISLSEWDEIVCEGKNEFEFNFNADSWLSNKKNIITCEYQSYQLEMYCDEITCFNFRWSWKTIDSRKWEIRTNPNSSTVMTGDYIMENDSDLQLLRGYNTVTGNLNIGEDIKNLEGLENLTTIGGGLGISGNNYIKNLTVLGNLISIGGLYIHSNDALTSLDGLGNITSVGGYLDIWANDALTSLSSLENITSVGGNLIISCNVALTSLEGLNNITSVGGDMFISGNSGLSDLSGLENITSVGGELGIHEVNLTNLSGLENLTLVGEDLSISGNNALTNLSGLENIKSIGRKLYIRDNPALKSISSLENITSIAGDLDISWNMVLISLSGLKNITSVGGDLLINGNNDLSDLSGLENITSVGGVLYIWANDALTSLSGLRNLKSIGGSLSIGNWYYGGNPALTTLGMTGLQRVGGDFLIIVNTQLCKSLAEELRDQVRKRKGIWGKVTIEGNKDCTMP